jgi:uncharacterized protein
MSAEIVAFPGTEPASAPCPICSRPSRAETRPFCSRRCADIDLARWLGGSYRIPGPEADVNPETEEGR